MKYDLFIRVALTEDLPERRLRRATWPPSSSTILAARGKSRVTPLKSSTQWANRDVVTVRESQIERLTAGELLSVRPLAASTR